MDYFISEYKDSDYLILQIIDEVLELNQLIFLTIVY